MQTLSRWILKISPLSDLPVLINGETGTGKELIARAIHGLDPKRSRGPFVPLNCAALGTSLAESELFGHRKGAFTGASKDRRGLVRSADGGTLFLDEIGDLELGLQGALLRVLQENRVRGVGEDREDRVNVRVVAATNRELPALVEQGRFRMDLFYRLNLLTTTAPTLAERGDDIEVLVRYFVHKYGGERTLSPAPSLLAALKAMSLPGNVRQLENLIRHAVVNAQSDGTLGIEAASAHGVESAVTDDRGRGARHRQSGLGIRARFQCLEPRAITADVRAALPQGRADALTRKPVGDGASARHHAAQHLQQDPETSARRLDSSARSTRLRPGLRARPARPPTRRAHRSPRQRRRRGSRPRRCPRILRSPRPLRPLRPLRSCFNSLVSFNALVRFNTLVCFDSLVPFDRFALVVQFHLQFVQVGLARILDPHGWAAGRTRFLLRSGRLGKGPYIRGDAAERAGRVNRGGHVEIAIAKSRRRSARWARMRIRGADERGANLVNRQRPARRRPS